MGILFRRIPKPYIGFVAMLFLVGATACEQLLQEGARDAVAAGREIRQLESEELRPLADKIDTLRYDEVEPRQRELEDLYREIEQIQRQEIEPLWNRSNDPWAPGGELHTAQSALQEQYALIDAEQRQIEIESRELERQSRDFGGAVGGFDPVIRELEDQRYELQRELDRLYRFGQAPIDDVWKQVNSVSANPAGSYDSNQFEVDQINNKIAALYEQANWLQSDSDARSREQGELRNSAQAELNDLYNFGRAPIDEVYQRIAALEAELATAHAASSAEVDALRGERDALVNSLGADIAQLESDINATLAERESYAAFYQATIDAKNEEINLLSASHGTAVSSTDGSASSTPEAIDNADEIATLQAEVAQVESDRDAILAPVDVKLDGLRLERDTIVALRQPDVDAINLKIAALEAAAVDSATTNSAVTAGLSGELDALRAQASTLEIEYTNSIAKLEGLLASIDSELNGLHGSGVASVDDVYREIEQLNARLSELRQVSEQARVQQGDAVNTLSARAEAMQEELNVSTRRLEEQLFDIDDQLQRGYRSGEDDKYAQQIAFNEAQRALQERRYGLDDRRWLLDQQQQDLYSGQTDPGREVQEAADLIYATRIQPLQDRINQLEDELRGLRDEEQALERELRLAEQSIRERERELEDQVFDILDAITTDPSTGAPADGGGLLGGVADAVDEATADDPAGVEPQPEPVQ